MARTLKSRAIGAVDESSTVCPALPAGHPVVAANTVAVLASKLTGVRGDDNVESCCGGYEEAAKYEKVRDYLGVSGTVMESLCSGS